MREYVIRETFERKRLESYLLHNQNNTNISVLLCLFTGLRIGELCGLKWGDIDFENGTISVQRTVQGIYKHGKSEVVIGSPKSKSSVRIVPVPDFVLTILKAQRKSDDFYIITGTCKPTEHLELCRIASRQFWKSVVSETLIFIFSAILTQPFVLKTASIQRLSASCSVMRTQALPSTDMFILLCLWRRIMWAD